MSLPAARAMPLWLWRQHATWLDDHLETYKKAAKNGVHCVSC